VAVRDVGQAMAAVAYNGIQCELGVKRRCRSNVEEYDDGCNQCIRVLAMLWFHTIKRHDWTSVMKSVSMMDRDSNALEHRISSSQAN
jgi:hypothetical protein